MGDCDWLVFLLLWCGVAELDWCPPSLAGHCPWWHHPFLTGRWSKSITWRDNDSDTINLQLCMSNAQIKEFQLRLAWEMNGVLINKNMYRTIFHITTMMINELKPFIAVTLWVMRRDTWSDLCSPCFFLWSGLWSWQEKWWAHLGSSAHCWDLWDRNPHCFSGSSGPNPFHVGSWKSPSCSAYYLLFYKYFCIT